VCEYHHQMNIDKSRRRTNEKASSTVS
jgi:hypothetical protein